MKCIEESHRSLFLQKRTPITARGRSRNRGEPLLLPWLSAVSDGRSDPKVPGGTPQVIQLHLQRYHRIQPGQLHPLQGLTNMKAENLQLLVAFIRSLPSSSASTNLALGE
jgi:hypothetical protein